ncbi:hypothetical protein P7L78_21930 [Tistrella bauzanensis]|uniref:hypothetical protein n=1 Tax=Tistrella TaxID=171436 RepID=UPI0031F683B9
MGVLTETIRAQAQGMRVAKSLFIKMDFASAPIYLWSGDGPVTRDGIAWTGFAGVPVSIEGMGSQINGVARAVTLTVSGVSDEMIAAVQSDVGSGEVEGRELEVFDGWWNIEAAAAGGELVPLDGLISRGWYVMQQPRYRAVGDSLRQIVLTGEGAFVHRSRPVLGLLSNRDQQARSAGDLGLEWTKWLTTERHIRWPRGLS